MPESPDIPEVSRRYACYDSSEPPVDRSSPVSCLLPLCSTFTALHMEARADDSHACSKQGADAPLMPHLCAINLALGTLLLRQGYAPHAHTHTESVVRAFHTACLLKTLCCGNQRLHAQAGSVQPAGLAAHADRLSDRMPFFRRELRGGRVTRCCGRRRQHLHEQTALKPPDVDRAHNKRANKRACLHCRELRVRRGAHCGGAAAAGAPAVPRVMGARAPLPACTG